VIATGTLIATPVGDMPVETLRAGDEVLAFEDGQRVAQPLRWVGRLMVDLARHPSPGRAAPVRIAAGALAPDLPARDLLLSPDHAVLLGGALVQAQALRNGATVAQDMAPERRIYAHLELPRHGMLLAEGMPAESYLDTGNRSQFATGRPARGLAPDLAGAPSAAALAVWKARGYAPVRLDRATIFPLHAAVRERAGALGWSLTGDPALSVLADDVAVPLARFAPDHFQARLPAGTRFVRLVSRCFVPADLDARVQDRRPLGIAVRGLRLAGRALPPTAFGRGWHLSEPEWRWTNGDARLTLGAPPDAATLELRIAPGAVPGYWQAAP
jgi:Hint domain